MKNDKYSGLDPKTPSLVYRDNVGDVFTDNDGKRWRVIKKTRTAIAVERYYWFNELWDKFVASKNKGGPDDSLTYGT